MKRNNPGLRRLALLVAIAALCSLCGCKSADEIENSRTPAPDKEQDINISQQVVDPPHVIEVAGTGKVVVSPDYAIVSLSVIGYGATVESAQAAAEEKSLAAYATILQSGVLKSDVSREGIQTGVRYEEDGLTVKQYTATENITVTVRKVTNVSQITRSAVDAAVATSSSGNVEIAATNYGVTRLGDAYNDAVIAAMEDARTKADVIAEASGVRIKSMYSFSEDAGTADAELSSITNNKEGITVTAKVRVSYVFE